MAYIFSSGRYCDPPDIRGPIILLLHLASRETLDRQLERESGMALLAALMSEASLKGNMSDRVARQKASTAQKQPGQSVAVPHCCSHLDSKLVGAGSHLYVLQVFI